jgi:ankyrin repeat protein
MLNAQNAEGATPLMMAAVMGNMPLVEVLLSNTKWVLLVLVLAASLQFLLLIVLLRCRLAAAMLCCTYLLQAVPLGA